MEVNGLIMITLFLCFIGGYIAIHLLFVLLYVAFDNWKTKKEFANYLNKNNKN